MIDISEKTEVLRIAEATCAVVLSKEIIELIKSKNIPKGDVLETAKLAGIQAAKDTYRTIPFCHPVNITFVGLDFEIGEEQLIIKSLVKGIDRTGVEMEALTAAAVAGLTVYDMCKPLMPDIVLKEIRLIKKLKSYDGR